MFKSILAPLALISLIGVPAFAGDVYEMNMSSHQPTAHSYTWDMERDLAKLAKDTNEEIVIHFFSNASLIKQTEVVSAVQNASAEFVLVRPQARTDLFPLLNVLCMPFVNTASNEQSVRITEEVLNMPLVKEEVAKATNNAHLIHIANPTYGCFATKGKPVTSLNDIRGKRWLVLNPNTAQEVMALGGTPVQISIAETYVGFQRGMGDGIYMNLPALTSMKLTELVKAVTPIETMRQPLILMSPKVVWDELPADVQQKIEQAIGGHEKSVEYTTGIDKMGKDALEECRKLGITIAEFSPEVTDELRSIFIEKLIPIYAENISQHTELSRQEAEDFIKSVYAASERISHELEGK